MSTNSARNISLVLSSAKPVTGTSAAIGILKTLLALKATNTSYNVTTDMKIVGKFPFKVFTSNENYFIEPNAIIRFIFEFGSLDIDARLEQEINLEWEEKILSVFLEDKDLEISKLLSAVESHISLGHFKKDVTAYNIAVFASIYNSFYSLEDQEKALYPSLLSWFEALLSNEAFSQALEIYNDLTKMRLIRQNPTFANRKVVSSAEFKRDINEKVKVKTGENNVLITSALPYVNNIPHLGNIIGSVLSADVYARYSRTRGTNTLFVCGTDEYGTATETKALEEKISCQELCDKYHKIHSEVYKWFNISFDHFGRTTTPKQTTITQDMFMKCYNNGYTLTESVQQLFCDECDRFLADRFVEGTCPKCGYDDCRGDQCDKCGQLINAIELITPRCKLDGNTPVVKTSTHLFLNLTKIQPECEKFVLKSYNDGKWSSNGLTITNSWLKEGLKPRCITRDLKWGVPVPLKDFENKVFYVWFDACIGYISITANYTDEWESWWKNPDNVKLYQFMGKDNVPFHTVVFPSTQIATGDPSTMLHHISTTEYLNYESGKFSKSRGVGVFGNSAKDTGVSSDVWRYYLLSNRPESSDTQFTWDEFIARNNNELLANFGNFCNRVLKFTDATSKYAGVIPTPPENLLNDPNSIYSTFIVEVNQYLSEYNSYMDSVSLKAGLRAAMALASHGNRFIQSLKLDNAMFLYNKPECDALIYVSLNLIYLLSAVFSPFMPSSSSSICEQLNAPNRLIPDTFTLDLLPGHIIGSPKHLFTMIDESMADVWRRTYGGSQQ
ncbi:hypothetical protein BB561_005107 [Smittium simulii]|uniref:methionine--tRNA ligase n=1 Tax=Smittium simulii TaxID=133385 RepID=A0A2T9YC75_9FUNG|nr:hypothetical protein BB561_005107 [Smittium simulii]